MRSRPEPLAGQHDETRTNTLQWLSRPAAMEQKEIRAALLALHSEVTHLLSEVPPKRSGWTAIIQRSQLRNLEHRFATLSERFDLLDAQLSRHAKLPKDYDAFRTTATLDLYSAVREAILGKLSETRAALDSLRSHAPPSALVALAVIGLAITIGLLVGIFVLAR